MTSGTVKFFNMQKGFGFIEPDNGGQDVFVHISAVERSGMQSLSDGQRVEFTTAIDKRKNKEAVDEIKAL